LINNQGTSKPVLAHYIQSRSRDSSVVWTTVRGGEVITAMSDTSSFDPDLYTKGLKIRNMGPVATRSYIEPSWTMSDYQPKFLTRAFTHSTFLTTFTNYNPHTHNPDIISCPHLTMVSLRFFVLLHGGLIATAVMIPRIHTTTLEV
jgi:hypothetical protein